MVEVYPVVLNLKLYDRSEEMQCSFSKTSQISNWFYLYCKQKKSSKKLRAWGIKVFFYKK